MNNASSPTVDIPPMALAPPSIDDLGMRGALYLAALLLAQECRLPVAPTQRATLAVLELLRVQGLIEVPWPKQRWGLAPDADETPIEQFQWRYVWPAYMRSGLRQALEDFLKGWPRYDRGLSLRLQFWEEVALSEAERYFEQQLAKNRFDPCWARDLIFVQRSLRPPLSISQWRYCCWAAVRHGAYVAHQQAVCDLMAVREEIYAQIRKRAGYVGTGTWTNCAFPPCNPVPQSALARMFIQQITQLGPRYWSEAPSLEQLKCR